MENRFFDDKAAVVYSRSAEAGQPCLNLDLFCGKQRLFAGRFLAAQNDVVKHCSSRPEVEAQFANNQLGPNTLFDFQHGSLEDVSINVAGF
jgi:hypothetical protein